MSRPGVTAWRLMPFFLTCVAMLVLLAGWPTLPGTFRIWGVGADKLAHAACAGVLLAVALPATRVVMPTATFRRRLVIAILAVGAAGGWLEVYQMTQPGRKAAWEDILANLVGLAVIAIAALSGRWMLSVVRLYAEPTPEVARARRVLGPLSTRFENGTLRSTAKAGVLGSSSPSFIPDAAGRSMSPPIESAEHSTPLDPAASREDSFEACRAPRRCAPGERPEAGALRRNSSETSSGVIPMRRGHRRLRWHSQPGSRLGAETRIRPYCRVPRRLR